MSEKIKSRICPRCNIVYKADADYCVKCQCELIDRKKSSMTMPLIIVAVIVLAVISALCFAFVYPEYAFRNAIESGDSDKLVTVFRQYPDLLDNQKRKEKYSSFIERCAEDFYNYNVSYEDVISDFGNFGIINGHLDDDDITGKTEAEKEKIEKIHQYGIYLHDAEEALENKDFRKAEELCNLIGEEDEGHYFSAQQILENIAGIKESCLTESEKKMSADDYEGSIDILAESLSYFEYDEKYNRLYHDRIIECLSAQSDYLMEKGMYFSSGGDTGAFNLIYSYLDDEYYANSEILGEKLKEIAVKSEASEISNAEKKLGLKNRNKVIDRCSDTAAEDYCKNPAIQYDNSYILSLCRNDAGVQNLLPDIDEENQVNVVLISNTAVTSDDFAEMSREKTELYSQYNWNYTGIGRFYDEKNKVFGWAVIIIYETEHENVSE